jgi:hypothetical protein
LLYLKKSKYNFFSARDLDTLFFAKMASAEKHNIVLRPRGALSQSMTLNAGRKVMRMRQADRYEADKAAIEVAVTEQKAAAAKNKEALEKLRKLRAQKKEARGGKARGRHSVKMDVLHDQNDCLLVQSQTSHFGNTSLTLDPELEPLSFPSSSTLPASFITNSLPTLSDPYSYNTYQGWNT